MKKTVLIITALVAALFMSVNVYAAECIQPVKVQIKVNGKVQKECIKPVSVKINVPVNRKYNNKNSVKTDVSVTGSSAGKSGSSSNTGSSNITGSSNSSSAGSRDELNINRAAQNAAIQSGSSKSVRVTDTADELHIYSDSYGSDQRDYGAKNSTDEFHTAPVDIKANDGYKKGGFDELHINENYAQNVWRPSKPVYRIEGFDEFRLPNEM